MRQPWLRCTKPFYIQIPKMKAFPSVDSAGHISIFTLSNVVLLPVGKQGREELEHLQRDVVVQSGLDYNLVEVRITDSEV